MNKEILLELIKSERPSQRIIELIDFRESKSGIEGVLYDVDVLIEHRFVYESNFKRIHYNLPYPLKPFKDHNNKKVKEMLEKNKEILNELNKKNKNL